MFNTTYLRAQTELEARTRCVRKLSVSPFQTFWPIEKIMFEHGDMLDQRSKNRRSLFTPAGISKVNICYIYKYIIIPISDPKFSKISRIIYIPIRGSLEFSFKSIIYIPIFFAFGENYIYTDLYMNAVILKTDQVQLNFISYICHSSGGSHWSQGSQIVSGDS